jgi:pre-mRNA-processing factor 40
MNGPAYAPPVPPVPQTPVWSAATAADGREYYFNRLTNVTQWDKPDELKDDVEVCDSHAQILT